MLCVIWVKNVVEGQGLGDCFKGSAFEWWRARAGVIAAMALLLRWPVWAPDGIFHILEEEPGFQTVRFLV